MDGAGAVGLHAAFGTPHRGSGFRHVQFLPVTQQKGFALTRREPRTALARSCPTTCACSNCRAGSSAAFESDFACRVSSGSKSSSFSSPLPNAESSVVHVFRTFCRRKWSWMVFCKMRENSIGSSAGRLIGVFFRQFEHRVLHDVERGVLVAGGEHRLLERATLDIREELRDFLWRGQSWAVRRECREIIGGFGAGPASKATRSRRMLQDSNRRVAAAVGAVRRVALTVTGETGLIWRSGPPGPDAVLQKRPFAYPSGGATSAAETPLECGRCFPT